MQLCEAGRFEGGDFVTFREGEPERHRLERGATAAAAPTHPRSLRRPPESPRPALRAAGDGVLLSSMELHNVTRVTRGTRVSLVVELWSEPANSHDRFE